MHFYIRFLKLPTATHFVKHKESKHPLIAFSTLITITNDLGEVFYPDVVPLRISIRGTSAKRPLLIAKDFEWTAGARNVPVQLTFAQSESEKEFVACVSCGDPERRADDVRRYDRKIPQVKILSVWSTPFGLNRQAEGLLERKLQIKDDGVLSVWEETGESIARHIWAGGLALTAYLAQTEQMKLQSLESALTRQSCHILELGAGCGIVGLAAARLYPTATVTVTDLTLAEEITLRNIEAFRSMASSMNVSFQTLDWTKSLPTDMMDVDVVLIADCVYNTDTIPLLVTVLDIIARKWPNVVIVMSYKKRHDSEIMFFEMMDKNGFVTDDELEFGAGPETVTIYSFKLKHDTSRDS